MATTASSPAVPFKIEVLEGPMASRTLQVGQPPGVVVLSSRTLPYRDAAWEGEQRVSTEWYPGNPVATQQLAGPVLMPTVIRGRWSDVFLGDGGAQDLVDTFVAMNEAGVQLKVEWGSMIRYGILQRYRFSPDNVHDIRWTLTFEWRGTRPAAASLISATGVQNPREGLSGLASSLQSAVDEVNGFLDEPVARLVSFPEAVLEDVDLALSSTFTLIGMIDNTADAVTSVRDLPRNVLERGVSVGVAAKNAMESLGTALLSINPSALAARDSGREIMDYYAMLFATTEAADDARNDAAEISASLEGQLYPEIIVTERLPPGTDLRDRALVHYGDPDEWWVIAQANGFRDSIVPSPSGSSSDVVSRPVRIPRRPDGDLSSLRSQGC